MFYSIFIWFLRIVAAIIMLQTLYFKFTAEPTSVALFTKIGMEPYGRVGTGVIELIASILILIPRYSWIGAGLGLAMMVGAIFFHLTKLGINFGGDPSLFILALVTFICCAILMFIYRDKYFNVFKI
jgi:uncharacterized membrane protein YphA (DoxX/SURF4 family)